MFTQSCLVMQLITIIVIPGKKDNKETGTMFRSGACSGFCCVLFVPLAVLSLEVLNSTFVAYDSLLSVTLLLSTSCAMLMAGVFMESRADNALCTCLVLPMSVLIVALIYAGGLNASWISSFLIVVISTQSLPCLCPASFTYGEACVVSHIIGYMVFRMMTWCGLFLSRETLAFSDEEYIYVFIGGMLVVVAVATAVVFQCRCCRGIMSFVSVFSSCALLGVVFLSLITNRQPVMWLSAYIFYDHNRMSLVIWMSTITITTISGFCIYTDQLIRGCYGKMKRASMFARKVFHVIVLVIYIPGIVIDPYFMLLASAVAFVALFILEVARLVDVQCLGPAVAKSFAVFADHRDNGYVLLTHFYLLAGISLPLWLSRQLVDGNVQHFSGIVALGIGDTVACVFGRKFGVTKWPGGDRSVEGTVASVLSQVLFLVTAFCFGWCVNFSWFSAILSVVITALFEAFCTQIDNLLLPLVMMATLPANGPSH